MPSYFLLEEIFPITDKEKDMGLKSDIAAMVEDIIDQEGVIPATYMSKICKYHFQYYNYKSALEKIKVKRSRGNNIKNNWNIYESI